MVTTGVLADKVGKVKSELITLKYMIKQEVLDRNLKAMTNRLR